MLCVPPTRFPSDRSLDRLRRISATFAFLVIATLPALTAVHEIYPDHHSQVFSAEKEPVLRLKSGDTVKIRTWDSGGKDHKGVWHIEHPYKYPAHGNPLMGPFYIEGAEYGDSIEVHLDKIRMNRKDGYTGFAVQPGVLNPGEKIHDTNYGMGKVRPGRETMIPWDADLEKNTVTPRLWSQDKSGWSMELPARPMLGCIGVTPAPAGHEVRTSGPWGNYGGNMDYNDIVEGATVLLPVFAKALTCMLAMGTRYKAMARGSARASKSRWMSSLRSRCTSASGCGFHDLSTMSIWCRSRASRNSEATWTSVCVRRIPICCAGCGMSAG